VSNADYFERDKPRLTIIVELLQQFRARQKELMPDELPILPEGNDEPRLNALALDAQNLAPE
jgi:hypothetical protein